MGSSLCGVGSGGGRTGNGFQRVGVAAFQFRQAVLDEPFGQRRGGQAVGACLDEVAAVGVGGEEHADGLFFTHVHNSVGAKGRCG